MTIRAPCVLRVEVQTKRNDRIKAEDWTKASESFVNKVVIQHAKCRQIKEN